MIKYFYLLIPLFFTVTVFLHAENENLFERQAHAWCAQVLKHDLSHEEMTLLMNLLYFSVQRSSDVMTLQHAVTRYAAAAGAVLNDAMGARRNPAKITSLTGYAPSQWSAQLEQFDVAYAELRPLLDTYYANASAYAHCLEYLIKQGGIRPELLACVEQLREDARQAMMATMQAHVTSIETLKDTLKKIMSSFSEDARSLEEDFNESIMESLKRGIVDCLVNFAAPAAIASFVKLDQKYNRFNLVIWQSLVTGYQVNSLLWDMLEKIRCDFYHIHYVVFAQQTAQESMAIAFDAEGYSAPDARLLFLPLVSPH